MRIKLDFDAYEPTRAHPSDAGLDIRAAHGGIVRAHQSAIFRTGVHVQLPPGTFGDMRSKSGLMFNHDITSDGTIDAGYRGEIRVILFNHGNTDYTVKPGDKITQLVVVPVDVEPVEIVDSLEPGERGDRGFGSTGR